jgi:hypothetical protein
MATVAKVDVPLEGVTAEDWARIFGRGQLTVDVPLAEIVTNEDIHLVFLDGLVRLFAADREAYDDFDEIVELAEVNLAAEEYAAQTAAAEESEALAEALATNPELIDELERQDPFEDDPEPVYGRSFVKSIHGDDPDAMEQEIFDLAAGFFGHESLEVSQDYAVHSTYVDDKPYQADITVREVLS